MRASLLALAKSIYYYCTAPFVNVSPKQHLNEPMKDPLGKFVAIVFSNF